MSQYFKKLDHIDGNKIYTKDGGLFLLYHLRGINMNPYSPDSILDAQASQERLFKSLSRVPAKDFLIIGAKSRTSPENIIRQCVGGVDNIQNRDFTFLMKQYGELFNKYNSGYLNEFNREYYLCVEFPTDKDFYTQYFGTEKVADVSDATANILNEQIMNVVPPEYKIKEATENDLLFLYNRARLRGIFVPEQPEPFTLKNKMGMGAFPSISFDKQANITGLFSDFLASFKKGERPKAKQSISFAFNSTLHSGGTIFSILNKDEVNDRAPEGLPSYQNVIAVSKFPSQATTGLATFTNIADQYATLDIDFALRFSYDYDIVSKKQIRKMRGNITAEAQTSTKDDLDVQDYADQYNEYEKLVIASKEARETTTINVTAYFAIAHPNRTKLEQLTAGLRSYMDNNGFTTIRPDGGNWETFTQMLPGFSSSDVTEDLKSTSPIPFFASCVPVRRMVLGDSVGFPVAINRENALGQIVRFDILHATEAGSGSLAFTGSKGSGKSYGLKVLAGAALDHGAYVHVFDQSSTGEYEVYSRAIADSVVVNLANPNVTLDILRIFEDEKLSSTVFMEVWSVVLGFKTDSDEIAYLTELVAPNYRKRNGIKTTRELLEHLKTLRNRTDKPFINRLLNRMVAISSQPLAPSLIDPMNPINRSEINPLPEINTDSHLIVFRTYGLTPPPENKPADQLTPKEQLSKALYLAAAYYTAERFRKIHDICITVGDEMRVIKGSQAEELLLRRPDREGRKEGNSVYVGTQLAKDFIGGADGKGSDESFELIGRKFAMRQETQESAEDALRWVGVPPSEKMIRMMRTETSPKDPNNTSQILPNRQGEGWLNDGNGNIGRVQIMEQMLPDRERLANTTTSKNIRADEVTPQTTNTNKGGDQ